MAVPRVVMLVEPVDGAIVDLADGAVVDLAAGAEVDLVSDAVVALDGVGVRRLEEKLDALINIGSQILLHLREMTGDDFSVEEAC